MEECCDSVSPINKHFTLIISKSSFLWDFKIRGRSSRPNVFCKKVALKFCKIHRKAPLPESSVTLLKKRTLAQVFSYESCEIFKNTFFYRTPSATATAEVGILDSYKFMIEYYSSRKLPYDIGWYSEAGVKVISTPNPLSIVLVLLQEVGLEVHNLSWNLRLKVAGRSWL